MRNMLNKKGFTLVELMIVVVILGILVAVAVPIFTSVTKNAKKKACESNMRIIRSGFVTYMLGMSSDNGEPFEFRSTGADVYEMYCDEDDFKAAFKDGVIPVCTNGDVDTPYEIIPTGANTFSVKCVSEGCPNEGNIG
jgi:prepilin-type N-terminal cleavage/methylation domain-containing protein